MEEHPLALKRLSRDEAQNLIRGTRIDPRIYQSLVSELQALAKQPEQALSMALPPNTRSTTMKARIKRIAKHLGVPLTIRKTDEGLVCWIETAEEEQYRLAKSRRTHRQTHT